MWFWRFSPHFMLWQDPGVRRVTSPVLGHREPCGHLPRKPWVVSASLWSWDHNLVADLLREHFCNRINFFWQCTTLLGQVHSGLLFLTFQLDGLWQMEGDTSLWAFLPWDTSESTSHGSLMIFLKLDHCEAIATSRHLKMVSNGPE